MYKRRDGTERKVNGRFIEHIVNHNGYEKVGIRVVKNKYKYHAVHRIVAEAFVEKMPGKEFVNHKDRNKRNNKAENLEWVTKSENQLHSIKTGLRTANGEKNSQSKLKEDEVLKILVDKRKYLEISLEYKISIPTISDIKRGYSWSHITMLKNVKKNNINY